jgi:hypothetical protein
MPSAIIARGAHVLVHILHVLQKSYLFIFIKGSLLNNEGIASAAPKGQR